MYNNNFIQDDIMPLTMNNVSKIIKACQTPSDDPNEKPLNYACGDSSTGWNNSTFPFYTSKLLKYRNAVLFMIGQLNSVHKITNQQQAVRIMEFFDGKQRVDGINWTITSEESQLPERKLTQIIFSRLMCFYTLAHACGIIEQFHKYQLNDLQKPRIVIACPILNKSIITPTEVPQNHQAIEEGGVEPADF